MDRLKRGESEDTDHHSQSQSSNSAPSSSIPPYPLSQPQFPSLPKSKSNLLLPPFSSSSSSSSHSERAQNLNCSEREAANMSLTIPTNLSKSISTPKLSSQFAAKPRVATTIVCQANSSSEQSSSSANSQLKAFSAALALSSIIFSSSPVLPASADISGLTPCKDSKQFAKREKQEIKKFESSLKLYAPDSAPALAIKATVEKTKRRFENYGKQGLLCGSDGLPHLIVSGDQRHWGEFITPGILFLYIAGWIGWVGRSYLIAVRDEKKPTMKEIIIDVPLANKLIWRGFSWPVAAYREYLNGELIDPNV